MTNVNCWKKNLLVICALSLLLSCSMLSRYAGVTGINYIAPRGDPAANSLVWSPKAPQRLLVSSRSLATGSGRVEILDLVAKEELSVAKTSYASLLGSSWSPDGKSIALSISDEITDYPKPGLWLFNTEDRSKRFVSSRTGSALWVASGTSLIVLTVDSAAAAHPRQVAIYAIDIQTSAERLVYSNASAVSFWGASVSPDGANLVFALHTGDGTKSDLFILDLASGGIAQLTKNGGSTSPAWSPKGDIIAYEMDHDQAGLSGSWLHLMTVEGHCDVELREIDAAYSPTWSPDSKTLAFISTDGIYTLDIAAFLRKYGPANICLPI